MGDEPALAFSSAAFSAARAPARMFTASLLSSLQAYSNIGPFTWLMGMTADQGFAHVVGSSIVNLYSIVSLSMRVKRSVILRVPGLALRKADSGLKLVLSTTSVSPSQWPRASPCHCWRLAETCEPLPIGMMGTSLPTSRVMATHPALGTMRKLTLHWPGHTSRPLVSSS